MADTPSTPLPEDTGLADPSVDQQAVPPDPVASELASSDPPAGDPTGQPAADPALPAADPALLAADPALLAADPALPATNPTGRTRISGAWVGVIVAAVVLTLLLVFILQNTKSVKISYFTTVVSMPVGVALLLAAIGGVLFAGTLASLRIWQLRHRLNGLGPSRARSHRTSHRLGRPKTA